MHRASARPGPPRFLCETRPRGVPIATLTRGGAAQPAPLPRRHRIRRGTHKQVVPRWHRRPTFGSVTPPGPPEDPNPVGLRLAGPRLAPGFRHRQAPRVTSDPIEVLLVNHVLRPDSLGTQFAGANPAPNGFWVATDAIGGARHGQHCSCILLQSHHRSWIRDPAAAVWIATSERCARGSSLPPSPLGRRTGASSPPAGPAGSCPDSRDPRGRWKPS